jgi:hypothetical protein
MYNGDFYKTALQRMLPKFEEKGAFRSWITDVISWKA